MKDRQWFIHRIGQRVFRDAISTDHIIQKMQGVCHVDIKDELHAQYLYDIQLDFKTDSNIDLKYRDEK